MSRIVFLYMTMLLALAAGAQNAKPQIVGSPNWGAAVGQNLCIHFISDDPDPLDSVTFGWDSLLPGMQVSMNNGAVRLPTLEICWTAPDSMASKTPYFLRIWALDNAKPTPDTTFFYMTVLVHGKPARTNYTYAADSCGVLHLKLEVNEWTRDFSVSLHQLDGTYMTGTTYNNTTVKLYPGTFVIRTTVRSDLPLQHNYTDTVLIDRGARFYMYGITRACRNQVFELGARASSNNVGKLNYSWWMLRNNVLQNTFITDSTGFFTLSQNTLFQCRITDSLGCEWVLERTVEFDDCVGLEEMQSPWSCYPNPAGGVVFIHNPQELETEWQLFDLSGSLVLQGEKTAQKEQAVGLGSLPTGVYFLQLRSMDGNIFHHKLIHH